MSGVPGRTRHAGWEAGARRTLAATPGALWALVVSAAGQRLLGGPARALRKDSPGVTTFVEGSHYRRRVEAGAPGGSRLQVRVRAAARGRATLALHRELLAGAAERAEALAALGAALDGFEARCRPERPAAARRRRRA